MKIHSLILLSLVSYTGHEYSERERDVNKNGSFENSFTGPSELHREGRLHYRERDGNKKGSFENSFTNPSLKIHSLILLSYIERDDFTIEKGM